MKMSDTVEKQGLRNILLIGVIFYPLFIVLDYFVYPGFLLNLLKIRLSTVLSFTLIYFLTYPCKDRNLFVLIFSSCFLAAFGISLMCFVTGAGFSSVYYAGNFLVLLAATVFFRIRLVPFSLLIFTILAQHFALLSFLPFSTVDLMCNVFFLGSFGLISIITHKLVFELYSENALLKDLLPICACCKRIRDDKGYWNSIEKYISQRSRVEFSHGLCSECAEKYYGVKDIESDE
jgi:hypothetical protein